MPKQRITKEMVVKAAFELAREGGMEKVLVKQIAEKIGCSVQPVYCYCRNMEGLRQDLVHFIGQYLKDYIAARIDPSDPFFSLGLAHAHFAKEEPHLYRIYFLRERQEVHSLQDIFSQESNPKVPASIAAKMGISLQQANNLYLNLLIYNVGISFILSCLGADADIEEITERLQQAIQAFSTLERL